jgi:hypothetical protein
MCPHTTTTTNKAIYMWSHTNFPPRTGSNMASGGLTLLSSHTSMQVTDPCSVHVSSYYCIYYCILLHMTDPRSIHVSSYYYTYFRMLLYMALGGARSMCPLLLCIHSRIQTHICAPPRSIRTLSLSLALSRAGPIYTTVHTTYTIYDIYVLLILLYICPHATVYGACGPTACVYRWWVWVGLGVCGGGVA